MTRRRIIPLVIAILLAVPAAIPIEAANKEHQQMMADLRMLQLQTQQLQAQLSLLANVLKTVTARLDEQAGINRKVVADSKVQADGLAGDVRVLREKADETNVRLSSMSQELEAIRQVQAAMQQAAQAAAVPMPATTQDPANPGTVTPGTATPPVAVQPPPTMPAGTLNPGMSPQRLFESARADYYAGQWSLASQGFETYIKTFPKSDLTDDAQYYIGETAYSSGKFKEAVAAYDRLIVTYPTSNTVPDAYYKRGLAFNALGQVPQAQESFTFVVKTYPESNAGRLAKQALDRLSRVPR
jgi:tol-pal system protein YbgF